MTHTAENKRDVSFIVLDQEKERIEKLAVNLFRKIKPLADLINPLARNNVIDDHFFFFKAPLVILVLAEDKTNGLLAAQNMEFVAEANGLGAVSYTHRDHNVTIKMPQGVPHYIEATFAVLIPAFILVFGCSLIGQALAATPYESIHQLIYTFIQTPLSGLGTSFFGLLVTELVMTLATVSYTHLDVYKRQDHAWGPCSLIREDGVEVKALDSAERCV